eukprot:33197-Hanusia_phi.AAC.1
MVQDDGCHGLVRLLFVIGEISVESFRTSPIVPELPAPDLIIKIGPSRSSLSRACRPARGV